MGNTASALQDKASLRSTEIDRKIEADSKKSKRDINVLLLGTRESGKSTIVKQMKSNHQNGFSPEERAGYRPVIYRNLWESAQAIVSAMRKLSVEPTGTQNQEAAKVIETYELDLSSIDSDFRFPEKLALSINRLWQDPAIPQITDRKVEFDLMDSAGHFLAEAERIGGINYLPTEVDIMKCWQKSMGITETRFDTPRLSICVLDVGEQRSNRRKWIHCFEGVTSILFCAALSEYDQVLLGQNCLAESLALFESAASSRRFSKSSVVLFLNKIDVFRHKLREVPLDQHFPDYSGGRNVDKATKYILWKFMQVNHAKLNIYPHIMGEADTAGARLMSAAVANTIVTNSLKDSDIHARWL